MNLNHWADGAWADGAWIPSSWGGESPPPPSTLPPGGRVRHTRARYENEDKPRYLDKFRLDESALSPRAEPDVAPARREVALPPVADARPVDVSFAVDRLASSIPKSRHTPITVEVAPYVEAEDDTSLRMLLLLM